MQIRFDSRQLGRVVVFFKGERQGDARPVDFVANGRRPAAAPAAVGSTPVGEPTS